MQRIAVVQAAPVLLDKPASIARAASYIDEAAKAGAKLVAFSETFVPGYPTWLWRLRPGTDMSLTSEIHTRLVANAVDLSRDELAPVREAARRNGVTVLIGIHEIAGELSRSTIFNTMVLIAPDGTVQNRHRKLMPTNPERMRSRMFPFNRNHPKGLSR